MEAAESTLFVQNNETRVDIEHVIDTTASAIENDLMDLLDAVSEVSSITFIESSEDDMDPFFRANFANVERNSYGRPVQRVQPTLKQSQTVRPMMDLPMVPSKNSAFTAVVPTPRWTQEPARHPFSPAHYLPMPVPFYPNNRNKSIVHNYLWHFRVPETPSLRTTSRFCK